VSRVGGNAQVKAMKSVAGRLRLDLAQFRELESFAAFGSDLDKASKAQLERGARLVELLKQAQFAPFPVERQVVSIWAGTSGQLDDVPVADIRKFEREFLEYVGRQHKSVYDGILGSGQLSDSAVEELTKAITDFKKTFETSSGEPIDKASDPMDKDEEGQESVEAHRRKRSDDGAGDSGGDGAAGDGASSDSGDGGQAQG